MQSADLPTNYAVAKVHSNMKPVTVRSKNTSGVAILVPLITASLVIVALFLGKEMLIPLALALLFSFLLTPPITWLEKLKLGRVGAVLIVLALAFSIASGVLWLGTTQLADIVTQLPRYQGNIHRKIQAMRNPAGTGLSKAMNSIKQISTELSQNTASETRDDASSAESKGLRQQPKGSQAREPVRVEVVKHGSPIVESLGLIGTNFAHFVGGAAAVLIFTLFMLLQRGDLRNRLFQLFGAGHLNVMTTALDDAAGRVSRYLLTQSLINGTFGLLLGLGLYWIGVPNAPFWGVLGAILRFIPYVGTLIAGLCPLVLALAVFEGWARPMLTLGLFATIESTMSAAIEPWLCGLTPESLRSRSWYQPLSGRSCGGR